MVDPIYEKLKRYNQPVKTKHLAIRLKIDDIVSLITHLNSLAKKKKIQYISTKNKKDEKIIGWIAIKN